MMILKYRQRKMLSVAGLPMLCFLSLTTAFAPPKTTQRRQLARCLPHRTAPSCRPRIFALASGKEDDDEMFAFDLNGEEPVILRGSDSEDIDGAIFEDLETGKPPEWLVMKELLGINIFTYILGALIVIFLSMNYFIGPGWLGSMIGIPGTGSFNEVSESFPDTIDLSSPEFRL